MLAVAGRLTPEDIFLSRGRLGLKKRSVQARGEPTHSTITPYIVRPDAFQPMDDRSRSLGGKRSLARLTGGADRVATRVILVKQRSANRDIKIEIRLPLVASN